MEKVDIMLQNMHDNAVLVLVVGMLFVYGLIKYINCKNK